jgi:hypothetical protein
VSERIAINLVFAGLFVLGLPLMLGLHALGASDQLVAFAVILLFCAEAWTLSAVTHYFHSKRRRD